MGLLLGLAMVGLVVVVSATFVSIGASVAGIEGRSFGKAIGATVGAALVGVVAGGVLSVVGLAEGFIGAAAGIAVNLAVIRAVYATSWGKSAVAWLVATLAIVVVVGVPLLLLGGLAALLG